MKKFLHLAFALLLGVQFVNAQSAPPSSLAGEELKTWLRTNWYDGKRIVLDYGTARGKMYNYIDNYNNTVTCVYSGYQESKAYSETSTSTAVGNINCEHTVPQSWFDEAVRMRSDIHHLFPTYIQWNSDRGSDPFAEIPDNQTTKWVRGSNSQSGIPTANIDEYSEDGPGKYEPREDHKGNVARAIFYFYTMHANERFDAGKNSISAAADINTLYQWHLQDPVDARERERNNRVEVSQGNRNPYIDYPDLVAKAWNFTPAVCEATTQITSLNLTTASPVSLKATWTNGNGNGRLVVIREGAAVDFTPSGSYTGINTDFSLAADKGNGHKIVYGAGGSDVTVTGLKANTTYHVQAFEYCASSATYVTANAPAQSITTPDYTCTGVPTLPTAVAATGITKNSFSLSWTAGGGDGRLVVLRKGEPVNFKPANDTRYTGANADFSLASTLSGDNKLIYVGAGNSITVTGLEPGAIYYAQIFESCSNGYVYATEGAPSYGVTTEAATTNPPVGNGNAIAIQDFNGTATDGWAVTSGFSKSSDNTGNPSGQRVRSGSSHQVSATTSTLEFASVDVTGKTGVYVELYNSSVSVSAGNGIEASDYLEVYVALNGGAFPAAPEIKITGDQSDNNVRYGMDGTAVIATAAGTPFTRTFIKADGEAGDIAASIAPSKLQVSIPDGTTSVKLKLMVKTGSSANEVWCIDDVGLYAAAATVDCDDNALENIAGENKAVCADQVVTIGAAAAQGYTYTWSPAAGLSDANVANPTVSTAVGGAYTYTVTATNGTCSYQDEVTVTVSAALAKPTITRNNQELTASVDGDVYEWLKDNKVIAGATSKIFSVTESGTYTVRVRNGENCYSEYSEGLEVVLQPNALPDAAEAGISIFPNPTQGKLLLTTKQPLHSVQVNVLNALGQVVLSKQLPVWQKQQELNLQHLPQGMYFIHINSTHVQAIQRIVLAK